MIASDQDIALPPRLPRKSRNRPHVISIVGKGGSGKSTTALQLGAIAKAAGHSVLILDADRQASLSEWTFVRGKGDISVKPCRPEQVLENIVRAGLSGIDLVLVDNAPNDNACSENIARAADLTIIMTLSSLFDLRVALTWLELCRRQGASTGVVINAAPAVRLGIESPLVRDARNALRKAVGRAWGGQITRRHSVIDCTANGCAVVETDAGAAAAAEFRQLWAALRNYSRSDPEMKSSFSEGLAVIPSDPAAALDTSGLNDGADRGKVQLITRLQPETRRALKRLAADGDTSVQRLMEEALADLFVKYRLPPSG